MKNKKTVIVLGAGSTAKLNIPVTNGHTELFSKMPNRNDSLLGRLKIIIDNLFYKSDEDGKYNYTINDIYNLIDSSLCLHSSLVFDNERIESYELENCKRDLITYIFKEFIKRIKQRDINEYKKLVNFYKALAKNEIREKINNVTDWTDRNSFISSYSIINYNWDLYSLLPIIEANNEINHLNANYIPIYRNPQVRIFTDFNCEYATAKENSNKIWYPFTEPAAYVANNSRYDTTRRILLTKCYYPHGAMNLFKCPSCAKHSFYLGELNLDSVVKKLDYGKNAKLYSCPFCNGDISSDDFDVLVQSNFKIRNAFLEEIRLSMIKELRNAKRLIFIGYSMPNDDVDFITYYKSLSNVNEVLVVLFDKKETRNQFVSYNQLTDEQKGIANNFNIAFGERAKYYLKGVSDAFNAILDEIGINY
ncbi:MAG: hypothetical protein K5765_08105 [Clostridia bacterium]|nr:hypothetical protein [Clostridia bacterium]